MRTTLLLGGRIPSTGGVTSLAAVNEVNETVTWTGDDSTGRARFGDADEVARRARLGTVLWGQGWDETLWPERRPPTRAELDRASGGAPASYAIWGSSQTPWVGPPAAQPPCCLRTVHRGRILFKRESALEQQAVADADSGGATGP